MRGVKDKVVDYHSIFADSIKWAVLRNLEPPEVWDLAEALCRALTELEE